MEFFVDEWEEININIIIIRYIKTRITHRHASLYRENATWRWKNFFGFER